jgi:hypothetical protein
MNRGTEARFDEHRPLSHPPLGKAEHLLERLAKAGLDLPYTGMHRS